MPKVECPKCSAKLDAPAEYEGRTAKCARCGMPFVLSFKATRQPITAKVPPLPDPPVLEDDPDEEFAGLEAIPPLTFRSKGNATTREAAQANNKCLHPCRDCGEPLSRRADDCPRCGASQRRSNDPFVLSALALSVSLHFFMSPIMAPLVVAACGALWLVGLARMADQRRIAGLILSACTFLSLAGFVVDRIEHDSREARDARARLHALD